MGSQSAEVEWVQSCKQFPNKRSFLDLPRECRDIIYQFAFQVPGAIFVYCSDPYAWRPVWKGKIVKYRNEGPSEPQRVDGNVPAGLMRTCRQLHHESAEVLYGKNVFRLYMSSADFAPTYSHLVRHITFTIETGCGIYHHDLEVMAYWWRRVFWPNLIDKGTNLLLRYPNLETLTFPIKSDQAGVTWRPAFLTAHQKRKNHRIAFAARWLGINCPMKDDRLRQVIHLEIMPSANLWKEESMGSQCSAKNDDIWDGSELAEAFRGMKSFLMRQV